MARAAAFGSRVIIMDEPTAALGVKESRRVLELILDVKRRGLPIVLISHNMPHVFEVADRIHIHRLGKRSAVIDPKQYSMSDAVAHHDRRHEAAAGRGAGDIEKDVIRKNCGRRLLSAATKARRRTGLERCFSGCFWRSWPGLHLAGSMALAHSRVALVVKASGARMPGERWSPVSAAVDDEQTH